MVTDIISSNTAVGGNVSSTEGVMTNSQTGSYGGQYGYLVDKDGNINLPVIGSVHVEGLTTEDIKDIITKKALVFYKSPVVNVNLANFKVGGLGLLGTPGVRVMTGERVTILDAIAAFGDIQVMGRKDNIMVIRQLPDNQKEIGRLNINSSSIMQSPYFYLKPGDIIYVEPRKAYAATPDLVRQSQVLSYVSIFSTITSAIITIIALSRL
jgi:polysaccharide export outer membrane protein